MTCISESIISRKTHRMKKQSIEPSLRNNTGVTYKSLCSSFVQKEKREMSNL